jgi:hypothetical protein
LEVEGRPPFWLTLLTLTGSLPVPSVDEESPSHSTITAVRQQTATEGKNHRKRRRTPPSIFKLHKQDFRVLEDGKPVTVDFFEEHTAKTLPPGAVPSLAKMPPNMYTNVPP